jgi:hypothetical protein
MERGRGLHLLIAAMCVATSVDARVLMTQQQALASAFPAAVKITRQAFFLTKHQLEDARRESGVGFDDPLDPLVVRYVGMAGDRVSGYAYFDTHRVRTLPETVMIVVTPDGRIDRIEILSFDEPTDYFPKRRWIDQFAGHKLDRELSVNGAIRPLSGASLTTRAIVNASRKILAVHKVLA